MTRHVFCEKLQQPSEGLLSPPFPGPLGERIFNHISQTAWNNWISQQTMLINEYRLSLIDPRAREFLYAEMEKYFFGDGSSPPPGFSAQNQEKNPPDS